MTKTFALACASHTPLLMDERYASSAICTTVKQQFATLAEFIRNFAPDYIIQFSPDHYHGFHYDVMPSFCVGAGATSFGDYGTQKGRLKVDEDFALTLLEAVRASDIDAALSFDMTVDHGFVQIWEVMFGRFDEQPIVPIFINAIGHPLPTYRRARLLGEAVGRFAVTVGKKVLFVASGGLSHDPLVPIMRGAGQELRSRLLGHLKSDTTQQQKREMAVHSAAALAMKGEGPSRPLNPEWDRAFLQMLREQKWHSTDALTPESVQQDAGGGGNEVLAWVAAASALSAAVGTFEVVQEDYLPIPGWIAGMAIMAAH